MKKITILFYAAVVFNCSMATGNKLVAKMSDDPIDDIKRVILQQLEGSAARDVPKMKAVMHDDFRIVINDKVKGPFILDLATMMGMYEQGRFGGEVKPIEMVTMDVVSDLNAIVKVRELGAKATFHWYITLVKMGGDWKIIEETVFVERFE